MEENLVQDASDTPLQQEGMPHEVLFLVLSYLPLYELLVMAQVCRSVKEVLTYDILPWLNMVVGKPLNKRFNDVHLLKITSKADGRLKTLALLNCSKITDEGLQQVIARNPYITRLWLPACTSLSPSGVIEAVKLLTKNKHRLKSLRINGIYNLKKEDLEILHCLIDDESHPWQKKGLNFYHEYKEFSTFKHSYPPIDVEICPKCKEARVVFDCPRDSCRSMRQQQKLECRGCQHCILRCEECGMCIKDEDPVEAACVDVLCLGCWLQLPKCSFCNKPYCSQHADQKCSLVGSSGFVCIDCHARFIEN
ncbi:F-box protein SKIP28-like [Coffea eugenioides]|uniref:F-box protein SKIP28 n=1 Tax=Coffea eugenioides TaxID=49369 RepID=UPI000F60561C|nr:F-box protein SKIP28 [Coffea eugenioides]XP_027152975.1 F-box protein SKIP28-like [Coffea eugenioides]